MTNNDKQSSSLMIVNAQTHDWECMRAIVNQHSALLPQARQFKKLVVTRIVTETLLVILLQYTGVMLSASSPVWLAMGTACAFAFLRGYSVLPGVWLGTFFAYYAVTSAVSTACACATIYLAQTFFLLWLTHRYITPTLVFYQRSILLKFILLSSLLTGITSFVLTSIGYSKFDGVLLLQGWLANLNGIFMMSCALLTLDTYFPQINALRQNIFKLSAIFLLLMLLIFVLLCSQQPFLIICFSLAICLFVLFISARLGWCGAVTAIFLFGMMLSLGAYLQTPIFASRFNTDTLFFLQGVLTTTLLIGLWIAV